MLKSVLMAVTLSMAIGSSVASASTGSDGAIRSAIRSNNADAIVAALEDAEDIICNTDCMSMVMELASHEVYEIREVAAWWFARRPAPMKELGSPWATRCRLATERTCSAHSLGPSTSRFFRRRRSTPLCLARPALMQSKPLGTFATKTRIRLCSWRCRIATPRFGSKR